MDAIYKYWAQEKASPTEKRRLLKYNRYHNFVEAVAETGISIVILSNVIMTDIVKNNNRSLNFLYLSLFFSLVNLSTRITQSYIRRIKSPKNYLYSKEQIAFDTLTDQEKLVIFYPSVSIVNYLELINSKRISKLYKPRYRSHQKFQTKTVIWIWILNFVNLLVFVIGYGIVSQVYILPGFGFSDPK